MALYIVHKRNPYYENGVVIELLEHGFQECILRLNEVTGNLDPVNHKGLVHAEEMIMPFCMKMLNRGLDDPKLRQKAGKGSTAPDGVTPDELKEYL